jgi:uncharacterized pyridoxal phosphate-containing UPF0001 family protein
LEPQKSGLPPQQVPEFAAQLAEFPNLNVRGLMTVALNSPERPLVAACFQRMRDLRDELNRDLVLGIDWTELSMGMTNDLELAIEYGATTVRIGTAIFGPREYPTAA